MKLMNLFGKRVKDEEPLDVVAIRVQDRGTVMIKLRGDVLASNTFISILAIDGHPELCVYFTGEKLDILRASKRLDLDDKGYSRNDFFHGMRFINLQDSYMVVPVSVNKGVKSYRIGNAALTVNMSEDGAIFLVVRRDRDVVRAVNTDLEMKSVIYM